MACLERLVTNAYGRPRPMSVLETRETVRSWCDGLRDQRRVNELGGALNQVIENLRIGCHLGP